MRLALIGARLIDPEQSTTSDGASQVGTLLIGDGRIVERLDADATIAGDWKRVDLHGRCLAPGFIDVHFHGELFTAAPDAFGGALSRAANRMLETGTTAFLATTVSWAHDAMLERVGALTHAIEEGAIGGASCLGVHLEGPWLNEAAAGAMTPGCLRPFDPARDGAVLDRVGEQLRMVTLAPELEGSAALLDALTGRGVVAALGHSRATAAQIDESVARGLGHVTHLFNAMGPFHHREPGVPGTVLADDRLTCDLICDGHHVHPDTVKIAARSLAERLLLITDRVDLPDRSPQAVDDDGPARLDDGTIAGSRLGMDRAVRNSMAFADRSLPDAVAAATVRPARLLGLESQRGTLRRGARADLVVLDQQGAVVETWMDGRRVFERDA